MGIWVNSETRLVVQGITGKEGTFHALGCRDYGTQVVGGVAATTALAAHRGCPNTRVSIAAESDANPTLPPPLKELLGGCGTT